MCDCGMYCGIYVDFYLSLAFFYCNGLTISDKVKREEYFIIL